MDSAAATGDVACVLLTTGLRALDKVLDSDTGIVRLEHGRV